MTSLLNALLVVAAAAAAADDDDPILNRLLQLYLCRIYAFMAYPFARLFSGETLKYVAKIDDVTVTAGCVICQTWTYCHLLWMSQNLLHIALFDR